MKKSYFSIIFFGYLLFLTIYSVIPTSSMKEVYGFGLLEFREDHILHLGAYFGVAILYLIWQFNKLVNKSIGCVIFSWLGCEMFAYFTEFLQLLVPWRTYNIYDFVANTIGVTIAFLFFVGLKNRLKHSKLRFVSV